MVQVCEPCVSDMKSIGYWYHPVVNRMHYNEAKKYCPMVNKCVKMKQRTKNVIKWG